MVEVDDPPTEASVELKTEPPTWPHKDVYDYLSGRRDILKTNVNNVMMWWSTDQSRTLARVKRALHPSTFDATYRRFLEAERSVDELQSMCIRLIGNDHIHNAAENARLEASRTCSELHHFASFAGFPGPIVCDRVMPIPQ